MKKTNRVLVFGDFDLFHPGHLFFLREAKKGAGELIVAVTRSSIIKKLKGRSPLFSDAHRLAVIRHLSFVDQAMLGDGQMGSFSVIKKIKPDIICIGHDQEMLAAELTKQWPTIPMRKIASYDPKTYKSGVVKRFIEGEGCLRCRI